MSGVFYYCNRVNPRLLFSSKMFNFIPKKSFYFTVKYFDFHFFEHLLKINHIKSICLVGFSILQVSGWLRISFNGNNWFLLFSELFELSCDGGFKISTNVTCFENEYSSLLNTFTTSFFVSGDNSSTVPTHPNDTQCFAQSSPSYFSNNLWTNSSYYFSFELGFHDCGATTKTQELSDIS